MEGHVNPIRILSAVQCAEVDVAADRQQVNREQRATGIMLAAAIIAQSGLSFARADFLALLLPAFGLGIVTAILTLRSDSALRTVRRRRALLALASFGLASLFALSLLVDDPNSPLLMQLSRMMMVNCAFLGLGRLVASFIARGRPLHG